MSERITATRVLREFSELLNQVRYKSQSYIVERNGKPIARLVPVSDLKEAKKLKELKNLLSSLPSCSDDLQAFAKDLEKIARQQHPLHHGIVTALAYLQASEKF
jgi:prevent-host-death family protein